MIFQLVESGFEVKQAPELVLNLDLLSLKDCHKLVFCHGLLCHLLQ